MPHFCPSSHYSVLQQPATSHLPSPTPICHLVNKWVGQKCIPKCIFFFKVQLGFCIVSPPMSICECLVQYVGVSISDACNRSSVSMQPGCISATRVKRNGVCLPSRHVQEQQRHLGLAFLSSCVRAHLCVHDVRVTRIVLVEAVVDRLLYNEACSSIVHLKWSNHTVNQEGGKKRGYKEAWTCRGRMRIKTFKDCIVVFNALRINSVC